MKLYAQQGYGTGPKIVEGLRHGYINGAIISPKDYRIERVSKIFKTMNDEYPDADRLFDPQFYATTIAHDTGARLGQLMEDDYGYFAPKRRSQLEPESAVLDALRESLTFQRDLNTSSIIAPNILIRQSLNSIDAAVAKQFIRHAATIWSEIGDDRPLLSTLAIDSDALHDRQELEGFLADITVLDSPPDGFYLLVSHTTSQISPELVHYRTLGGWMLLNHSLSINGFDVINGFSDILTPFLCAAGGNAGATGWYGNLKVFSTDRFEPAVSGGRRRPIARYLSKTLLNSIRFDELERLRYSFPDVLNDLPTDYSEEVGSEPDNTLVEMLQTWNAIQSFSSSEITIENCLARVNEAKRLYDQINSTPGMRLSGRSNANHLDHLQGGLELFSQLAEIDLR